MWKTQYRISGSGPIGFQSYANEVVTPDGKTITVGFQTVKTGEVKTEPLPVEWYGPHFVRQSLVNPTGAGPEPDELCEFIAAACNAASK